MKLEEQVSSLDLSKKLKELGIKQESYFNWQWEYHREYDFEKATEKRDEYPSVRSEGECDHDEYGGRHEIIASAFTCSELGAMLPAYLGEDMQTSKLWLGIFKSGNGNNWTVKYGEDFVNSKLWGFASNQANAYAKMLIYLIEHGLIKV